MNELELKYGCNPNQKPARIFMKNGKVRQTKRKPLTYVRGSGGEGEI